MTYNLEIQEKQHFIEVKLSGERIQGQVVKDSIAFWAIVAKKCKDTGISRILLIIALMQ